MGDDFDIFGELDSQQHRLAASAADLASPYDADSRAAGENAGGGYNHAQRSSTVSWLRWLAGFSGLTALLASLGAVTRAVAPAAFPFAAKPMLVAVAAVAAALAIALVIIARTRTPRTMRSRIGSLSIVSAICALMLAGAGMLISSMAPQGIIKPAVQDVAPVENYAQMKRGLEQVAGVCHGGWREFPTSGYPGVAQIMACTHMRVAYVTFDSKAAAAMDRAPAQALMEQLLQEHADDARAKGDWSTLNGPLWIAVGQRRDMVALQKIWGGTLETLENTTE